MFGARLPLSSLAELCRTLRHYLSAGLTLRDAFRQQAKRGPTPVRPVAARISERIDAGESLEDALKPEADVFPPLLISLTVVAEQTGMLPEVFHELEKYYTGQQKLRRDFLARITMPVIQFFAAVFVIAALIWVLGIIAGSQGPRADPLGLGLSGEAGALTFLGTIFGSLAAVFAAYLAATRVLRQGAVDGMLLRLPAVGPCLQALALTRFCTALRLTMETAMPIGRALKLSFRATANTAFVARSSAAQSAVKRGDSLTSALTQTDLFPEETLAAVAVGEESGRLHDVLRRLADQYHEEAGRRAAVLGAVAGHGVWLVVAGLIIFAIFRIFSNSYLSQFS